MGESALLSTGFLALTGAVLTAHSAPATGYELSLYTGTPLSFWALFGCVLLISLLVSLEATTDWYRRLALGLGGGAAMAFVGLPVLRGYRFYGAGDALTHLGWMRSIQSGVLSPTELKYPALHTVTILLESTVGIDLTQAALLVVVLLACLFCTFVALSTAAIFESRYSTAIGAFSAFLLLPVTNLSTYIIPHAMSQAILFSSVVLYLLLRVIFCPSSRRALSAVGTLFAVTSVALVFYHPQLAAHFLVVCLGICALQLLYRRYRTTHPIADHRPIYGQTLILAGAFLIWTTTHDYFTGAVRYAVSSAVRYFVGDTTAAASAQSQSASLNELGASVAELFLKLFGSSLVFMALVGLLVLWTLRESDGTVMRKTHGVIPYFIAGLVGLAGLFALYFFGSYSGMYFRVFGFMMLFITVLGAVAIAYGMSAFTRARPSGSLHSIVTAGFGLVLLLSLIAVFPSPYIYSASPHVTEMSMTGHETAFENQDADVTFVGIRAGPNRYADAMSGKLDRTRQYSGVTGDEITDGIPRQYSGDRYLTVTESDWQREVRAYHELRYTRSQLSSISSQGGVNRVQSNGEFTLYYVHGTAE
ncbi:hypothetical protein BDK88_2005 [Natrinema hispanicum]|uniref:Dolichyl-phosphate-mannose-protein mannosyltransferase n=1 Tax=Natrinema hispanicum TaxID=392421 RepID=A0A482Y6R6_9EURY|nr:hypothetical protein [Natrinema hispanicum]RZV10813.1 hypothetical protein BDK88_2005 [Natrinema hispanicum]